MLPCNTSRPHSNTHLQNNPGANCLPQSCHAVNAMHSTLPRSAHADGLMQSGRVHACFPHATIQQQKGGSPVIQAEERTDTEKLTHSLTLFALVHHQALHVVCFQDANECCQLVDTELPNRCTVQTVLNRNTCTELQLLRCNVKRHR